jgi:hypothetical protein
MNDTMEMYIIPIIRYVKYGYQTPGIYLSILPFIYSMIHEIISLVPSQWEGIELLKAHMRNKKGSVNSIGELEANGRR